MFLIKNAIKNIYRYKNKYILFAILYFIAIFFIAVTVNLYLNLSRTNESLLREYCSVVKITGHDTSKEDYLMFEKSNYVEEIKFFNYNFCTTNDSEQLFEIENIRLYTSNGIKTLNFLQYDPIFIFGYNLSLQHLLIEDFNIAEGRMFEEDNECVISKNSKTLGIDNWGYLDIGDTIVFEIPNVIYKEFTIVGILEEYPFNDKNTKSRFIHTDFKNAEYFENVPISRHITTHYDISAEHGPERRVRIGYDALIYLRHYNDFDNFKNEVLRSSNNTRFVESLFDNFQTLRGFIINMQSLNTIFTILAALIIIIITIISTTILLKSRQYEIAVLRSAGMSKNRLLLNYLIENIAFIWSITLVALVIAQFIAPLFLYGMFENMQSLVSPEMFDNLTQGVSFEILLKNVKFVFGGATAVVIFSLIITYNNIVRFEPLMIFNKQY